MDRQARCTTSALRDGTKEPPGQNRRGAASAHSSFAAAAGVFWGPAHSSISGKLDTTADDGRGVVEIEQTLRVRASEVAFMESSLPGIKVWIGHESG